MICCQIILSIFQSSSYISGDVVTHDSIFDFYVENFMTGYRIVFDREKLVLGWKKFDCKCYALSSTNELSFFSVTLSLSKKFGVLLQVMTLRKKICFQRNQMLLRFLLLLLLE